MSIIWFGDERGPHILLTKRPDEAHLGGFWEYPGGKIKGGESAADAARREVLEETGIALAELHHLVTVEFAYPAASSD